MRTRGTNSGGSLSWSDQARSGWDRFQKLNPAARLGALTALVALIVAACWMTPDRSADMAFVFGGHGFPPDELATARAVLTGANIRKVTTEGRRLAVPADQLLQAQVALKKAQLDPRSFDEIVKQLSTPRIFEDPKTRDARIDGTYAAMAELLIEEIPGIASAKVHYIALGASGGARKRSAKVVIDLRTESGRPPSNRMVRESRDLARGVCDYTIRPEDFTITGGGRRFQMAGDRTALRRLEIAAREEEWADEITATLAEVDGLRVSVALTTLTAGSETSPAPLWPSGQPGTSARPRVNEPIGLDPEPVPPVESGIDQARATVSAQVPRFYYRRLASARGSGSYAEDRQRTERRIEEAVRSVVPAAQLDAVLISEVDLPPTETAIHGPGIAVEPAPSSSASRAVPSWWIPAGAGVVLAVGSVALLAMAIGRGGRDRRRRNRFRQRNRARSPRPSSPTRHDPDPAVPGPGLAEQVRDLVRHNPDTAAGVLRRWIGPGGNNS